MKLESPSVKNLKGFCLTDMPPVMTQGLNKSGLVGIGLLTKPMSPSESPLDDTLLTIQPISAKMGKSSTK
jgi:hypothetical protein